MAGRSLSEIVVVLVVIHNIGDCVVQEGSTDVEDIESLNPTSSTRDVTDENQSYLCSHGYLQDKALRFNNTSYVQRTVSLPQTINNFTICLWFRTTDNEHAGTIFHYSTVSTSKSLLLSVGKRYGLHTVSMVIGGVVDATGILTGYNDGMWHYLCAMWTKPTGVMEIYFDDRLVLNRQTDKSATDNIDVIGDLTLGQMYGGTSNFDLSKSFIGDIANLNMWSYIFDEAEIRSMRLNCDDDYCGDLIAWSSFEEAQFYGASPFQSNLCDHVPVESTTSQTEILPTSGMTTKQVNITGQKTNGFVYSNTMRFQEDTLDIGQSSLESDTTTTLSKTPPIIETGNEEIYFTGRMTGAVFNGTETTELEVQTDKDQSSLESDTTTTPSKTPSIIETGNEEIYFTGRITGAVFNGTETTGLEVQTDKGQSSLESDTPTTPSKTPPIIETGNEEIYFTASVTGTVFNGTEPTGSEVQTDEGPSYPFPILQDKALRFNNTSYVQRTISLPQTINNFTICLWFRTTDNEHAGTIFHYSTVSTSKSLLLSVGKRYGLHMISMVIGGVVDVTGILTGYNDGIWHYLCAVWKKPTGVMEIYFDDRLVLNRQTDKSATDNIDVIGDLTLGQMYGGTSNFDLSKSFIGDIANLNMWSYIFDEAEIRSMRLNCYSNGYGNLIPWTTFRGGDLHNVVILESTVCGKFPISTTSETTMSETIKTVDNYKAGTTPKVGTKAAFKSEPVATKFKGILSTLQTSVKPKGAKVTAKPRVSGGDDFASKAGLLIFVVTVGALVIAATITTYSAIRVYKARNFGDYIVS
ncbi:uncharacterized protein LOC144439245 [Glandiceps talaboti]